MSSLKDSFFCWFRKKLAPTLIFALMIILFFNLKNKNASDEMEIDLGEVAQSVVNVLCESKVGNGSGGSGIIISEEGLILTNAHIIPHEKNNLYAQKTDCIVTLPDPITGLPKSLYIAKPIIIPTVSDEYDLAYLRISDGYYSKKKKSFLGDYPRKFPAFNNKDQCQDKDIKLGESVRIFGYPDISGGKSLTITEGIVSSFPEKGLIVTSAKVSYGSSGGLAVNRLGCMVGIPSRFKSDDGESMGIIISKLAIDEFTNKVWDYMQD